MKSISSAYEGLAAKGVELEQLRARKRNGDHVDKKIESVERSIAKTNNRLTAAYQEVELNRERAAERAERLRMKEEEMRIQQEAEAAVRSLEADLEEEAAYQERVTQRFQELEASVRSPQKPAVEGIKRRNRLPKFPHKVSAAFTQEELTLLKSEADFAGTTVSDLLRESLSQETYVKPMSAKVFISDDSKHTQYEDGATRGRHPSKTKQNRSVSVDFKLSTEDVMWAEEASKLYALPTTSDFHRRKVLSAFDMRKNEGHLSRKSQRQREAFFADVEAKASIRQELKANRKVATFYAAREAEARTRLLRAIEVARVETYGRDHGNDLFAPRFVDHAHKKAE